jgi:hypothetical protein
MRARFLGKVPNSSEGDSPTLFTLIEIPEDVLMMYVRRYQQKEGDN